jgi:hypothetical protein
MARLHRPTARRQGSWSTLRQASIAMSQPRLVKIRRTVGDILLVLSAAYIGLSVFGGPLWFPYDLAIAILVGSLAWLIGDYKHRWWPAAPMRDRDHEFNVERGTKK